MANKLKQVLLLIFCLNASSILKAQPFSLDERIKPVELNFINIDPPNKPMAKGRMNVATITQTEDTMYFFGKGFSTYAPAYIGVTAKDAAIPLDVGLFKENWLKASREGSTGDKGFWEDKFRTEGDMGLRIIAKTKPASYTIVVWNGEDYKVEVPSPFSKDNAKGSEGGGFMGFLKKNYLYVIIGLLVIVIAFLFMRSRKKNSA
jgi:LPXTG-motif cell wall-anchored protein